MFWNALEYYRMLQKLIRMFPYLQKQNTLKKISTKTYLY